MSKFYNSGIFQYAVVVSVIAATVIFSKLFFIQKGYYIVSFILLFEVSLMAIFLRIIPILLASTISALVWNYFFIPPHFAFHIERTEDKLMFGSFFFFAIINGVLTNRIRRQETLALEREERTNAVFQLTRDLSNSTGLDEILDVALTDLRKYFKSDKIWIIHEKAKENMSEINTFHSEWVLQNSIKAGKFTNQFPESKFTYYPLPGKRLVHGVVVILIEEPFSTEKELFWTGFLTQISNALERELLNELAHQARLLSESDKLYKTLFTLISHEFRIPIAAIMGASDTLLIPETSVENRIELSREIFKASSRLNHLVENLLNMSRLESGKICVNPDWCDINDLLNDVRRFFSNELKEHSLLSSVPYDMPLVKLDYGLMEQVIYNLILNSCQYTPPGSVIRFQADYDDGYLKIVIEDNGPGFSPEHAKLVFNKFFRGHSSLPGGLGLGLSIVKGLVEAHKGTVIIENKTGGARFIISIPSEIPDLKNIKAE